VALKYRPDIEIMHRRVDVKGLGQRMSVAPFGKERAHLVRKGH
jgi:hypothetical protein